MAASLMLAEPTAGPQGRRSDVAITKNVSVRVFDVSFSRNLYYSVGVFSKVSSSMEWGEKHFYGSGKQPSVALINKDEQFYAIEVHRSQVYKQCFYRVGRINMFSKTIEWMRCEKPMCLGVKPKVSATDSGKIVVVNEQVYSRHNLQYQIGKLVVGDGNPSVIFSKSMFIVNADREKLQGVEPDIAIDEASVILIYRSGFQTLSSCLGTFAEDDKSITWHDLQDVPGTGINPCISFNSDSYLVESHQTKLGRHLRFNHGRINYHEKKVIWGDLTIPTLGEYPAIALSNDGFVVELHKTYFGQTLYHSCGELKIRTTPAP